MDAEVALKIPVYDRFEGVRVRWIDGHEITVALDGNEITIEANPEGLVTLAIQLLTLAQDGMPSKNHIHLGAGSGLDSQSLDLTLQRK